MREHLSREQYVESLRAKAQELALEVLSGRGSVIAAARLLAGLLSSLDSPALESARGVFVAVDSQTDHLPLGPVRALWAQEALAELDEEIAEAERTHAAEVADACRQVLNVLQGAAS